MLRKAVASLAVLLLSSSLLAQEKLPQLTETVEVSIINIDVVVTDKQGNRVHGLTENDFEIYENGKRQPLSNFAEYSSAMGNAQSAVEGGEEAPKPQPRTIVLFVEKMAMVKNQADTFYGGLRNFLKTSIAPDDKVSLVYWNPLDAEQKEYSSDIDEIVAALDDIEKESLEAQINEQQQVREETIRALDANKRVEAMLAKGTLSTLKTIGGGSNEPVPDPKPKTGSIPSMSNSLEMMSPAILPMQSAYNQMQRRVHAINSTIATMGAGDGRKVLLLATRRFGEIAGIEYQYLISGETVPNELRSQFNTDRLTKSVIANANANGVTIYPLFAPGLAPKLGDASFDNPLPSQYENLVFTNETANLKNVAAKTGGVAAYSAKDVVMLLPQVAADVNDYYSLAYRVQDKREDRARNLAVKVKNRDYSVRTREAFVEKSDETRMKDRLTAALFTSFVRSDIPVTAEPGERKQSGKLVTIPINIKIPIRNLTIVPYGEGKYAGSFTVYIASAADLDEISDFTHKTQPFEIKQEDLQKATAGYFTYVFDVSVNQQVDTVAVGVLDEVSKSFGVTRVTVNGGVQKAASK